MTLTNGVLRSMPKVRDIDIKKLSIPKQEFMSALKKVSQRTEKPRSSPKMNKEE